jgi:DNA-binding transcriptional ArsR family regulator
VNDYYLRSDSKASFQTTRPCILRTLRLELRTMRRISTLDALFPKTRQAVLATIYRDPTREWYLSNLARHLKVQPSSLQRELANLVDAGILRRRADGNRTYYSAEIESPIFGDLHGLLRRTAGLRDVLAEGLEPFSERIDVAFVYGSVARKDEHSASDVDLMVIGRVGLAELSPALKGAEEILLRPVNPSVYTANEVAEKLGAGHHFLTSVMSREKLFVLGNTYDLAAALERKARSEAHNEQAGA